MSTQTSPEIPGLQPQPIPASESTHLTLSHVPFSVICDALRAMRSLRAKPGGAGRRRRDGAPSGTRRAILTSLWKEVAGRAAAARTTAADSAVALQSRGNSPRECGRDPTNVSSKQHTSSKEDAVVDHPHPIEKPDELFFVPAESLPELDSFVMLCLLAPDLDPTHPVFNLKELKLAEHYVDALCLRRNAADAQWLQHYNDRAYRPDNPHASRRYAEARDGNFPSILCAILKDRCRSRKESRLTIGRVWDLLDLLYKNKEAWGSGYYRKVGAEDAALSLHSMDFAGRDHSGTVGPSDKHAPNSKGGISKLKREARLAVFRELIQDGTAEENAEFARIILKDLEIRFKVLPWFHPHAYQHYAQSHDLRKLVKDCRTPGFELGEPEVHPGRYAAVMLTARPARSSLARVAGNLASGIAKDGSSFFYMEPKLDGERVQLHKIGNDVQTYSRSARESSVMYAELLRDAVCHTVRAMNAILDGEVVVWYRKTDQEEEGWVKFESLRRAIRDMSDRKVPLNMLYTLKYIVFDVLYIEHDHPLRSRKLVGLLGRQGDKPVENSHGEPTSGQGSGQEYSSNVVPGSVPVTADSSPVDSPSRRHRPSNALIKYSLQRRLELLKANIRVTQSHAETNEHENYKNGYVAVVEVIESKAGSSEGDMMDALTQYVDGGYEGLIAKNPQKPYILAHRDPTCSIKLKPDYFDGGLQDIDVVILGAKRGKGIGTREGRAGELSSFLIGARTHNSDEAKRRYRRNEQGSWTPIGSVGTGYTVDELTQLLKRLQGHWRRLNRADRQAWPSFWDTSRTPDSMFRDVSQWIDPRDSAVLQVRAYELARNRGFALRFPRCERIREDSEKPYYDVISVDELIELDDCKTPAVIASANGNDEDEVVESETGNGGRKRNVAEASVIARLEAGNAKVTRAAGGKRQAFSHETAADVSDITDRLQILHGSSFQVYASHGQAQVKHELERLIYRLGGEFDQRLTSRTTHCVGIAPNDRMVVSHIRTGRSAQREDRTGNRLGNVSILRPDWFHECERKGYAVPILRRHLFFASKDLNAILLEEFDIFGDGWVTPSSVDSLIHCFGVMDAMVVSGDLDGNPPTTKDENIECAVSCSMRKAGSVFWGLHCYVPQQRYRHLLIAAEMLLDAYGAVLLDKRSGESQGAIENRFKSISDGAVTLHVLVEKSPNPDTESAHDFDPDAFCINAGISLELAQMSFVSSRWVSTCLQENSLVPAFV